MKHSSGRSQWDSKDLLFAVNHIRGKMIRSGKELHSAWKLETESSALANDTGCKEFEGK